MKLSKIFALAACLLYLNSANATTACMPWPTYDAYGNHPKSNSKAPAGWNSFEYKVNGVSKAGVVLMMPGCSNQEPTNEKQYSFDYHMSTITAASLEELPVSSSADSNKYCWCKMVYPFTSKWMSIGGGKLYDSGSQCATDCWDHCTSTLSSSMSSMQLMSVFLQNIDN